MQTYSEQAAQVAVQAQVAVLVLLNEEGTDLEFWRLKPQPDPQNVLTPRDEFVARKLHCVGVVGINGVQPLIALKEPLAAHIVNGIAYGFIEYLRVLLGDGFAGLTQQTERPEPHYDWTTRRYV